MPFHLRMLVLAIAAFATLPSKALAQNTGKVGLSIGYPTLLGLLWQPSTRVGIRPELSVDFADFESTLSSPFGVYRSSSDFWRVGVGISALFLLYREDDLSLYLSPRYVHHRSKTTNSRDAPTGVIVLAPGDRDTIGHTLAGSLGARYALGTRFAVFGELGMDHDREESTPSSENESKSSATTNGIRSSVGVVFFF